MTVLFRLALVGALITLLLGACTSIDRPTVQSDQVPLPTPLRSFDASLASTIAALESSVATVGERLETPAGAYRPSEPASLLQAPRVVRRVELADLDDGFVVIYQTDDEGVAQDRAADLADYLGSGFGQTNYAADTQFSVSVLEDTVIFTTWSSRRSDDPDRAQAAFEAVAGVGTAVHISK